MQEHQDDFIFWIEEIITSAMLLCNGESDERHWIAEIFELASDFLRFLATIAIFNTVSILSKHMC